MSICGLRKSLYLEWRIQDFSDGMGQLPNWDFFANFFAENCMKMKEIGPGVRIPGALPPLDPPMIE